MGNTVKANRVGGDEHSIAELKEPGDFRWSGGHMTFVCPCGCGGICGITVKPDVPSGWNWNGDLDRPTTSPSIRVFPSRNQTPGGADPDYTPCKGWHGYLTNGVFEACE